MKKIRALIWKEWREARLFFIVALLLICVTRIVSGAILTPHIRQDSFILMSTIVFPVFASMIATIHGCREFENETRLFLVSRPASSLAIVSVKFLTGLALMTAIVCIAHAAFLPAPLPEINNQDHPIFVNMFSEIEQNMLTKPAMLFFFVTTLYSSLFLTSLIVRRTLASIFIAPILTLLLCLIIFMPIVLILMASSTLTIALTFSFILISIIFTLSSVYVWIKNTAQCVAMWKILLRIVTAWFIIGVCGAVGYAYIYISTSRELARTVAEAKKAGILLNPSELAGPPVPDQRNAALIYKKGFSLAKKLDDIFSPQYGKDKETARLFRLHKAELDRLFAIIDKAAEYPECKFDVPSPCKPGPDSYITTMSYLNSLRIKYAFKDGKKKEGIKAVYSGFALANSLRGCPDDMAINLVRLFRCIPEITSALNHTPTNSIPAEDYIKWMHKAEISDTEVKHIIISSISHTYYRYIRNITDRTSATYQGQWWNPIEKFLYECHLATPSIRKTGINYLKEKMRHMTHINEPFWKVKREAFSYTLNTKPLQYPILWDYADCFWFKANTSTNTELYKTFFALKAYKSRHGEYPAKLAELVPEIISKVPMDPFSGKELLYKKDKNGFILYSVGWDIEDSGGSVDDDTIRCSQ